MRLGFVSAQFPVDLRTSVYGGFRRMGMFIDAMKQMGELDALFYVHPDFEVTPGRVAETEGLLAKHWDARIHLDLCNIARWRKPKSLWGEYISPALRIGDLYPYQQTAHREQVQAIERLLARKPDVLFVHRLVGMTPLLLSGAAHPFTIFDLDDIDHVAFTRSIKQPPVWPGKKLYYLRVPLLRYWERRALRCADTTIVCSGHDERYLHKMYGPANVAVVPNAVTIPEVHELPDRPTLLFLGLMSYVPNAVGADYLIGSIWPLVSSAVPRARLLIAGARADMLESFASKPSGVEFLGFVDDLNALYEQVAVVCCPVLAGGGTRIKILEAAAYGKPVVSTTVGAEGLELKDGEEILLRDTPASFAEACIRLLRDRELASRIGRSARAIVERDFDRADAIKKIRMLFDHA
jgi:glycosyltransferase involved in cell wall biosynthesis